MNASLASDSGHRTTNARKLRLIILMPVRDDWACASELVRRLDCVLTAATAHVSVLMVDDGSQQRCMAAEFNAAYTNVTQVQVLRLRRNLGHQRAIAIGLAYVHANVVCDAIMVMDADGEDTPEAATKLMDAFIASEGMVTVFAARGQRTESLVFKFFYRIYRILHRWFTGITIRVGNFSIISFECLSTLVAMSELWNHYAAAVIRSRLPLRTIALARGRRIAGDSRMNFASLVSHGLSAISVFADIVGVRLLIASLVAALISCVGIVIVVVERFFTQDAIPGWATSAVGVLLIIAIQCITIATSFTFFMLSNRINLGFVPFRDYALFVETVSDVCNKQLNQN